MNEGYINQAKHIYEDNPLKDFLCEDLGEAKPPDAAFDVSLLIDFTHHLSNEELRHVFVELNRVISQLEVKQGRCMGIEGVSVLARPKK